MRMARERKCVSVDDSVCGANVMVNQSVSHNYLPLCTGSTYRSEPANEELPRVPGQPPNYYESFWEVKINDRRIENYLLFNAERR